MQNNTRSGAVYRNQNGAGGAWVLATPSSGGVEHPALDPQRLGTGATHPSWSRVTVPPQHPRPHLGGQHTLGLFGVPGFCAAGPSVSDAIEARRTQIERPEAEARPAQGRRVIVTAPVPLAVNGASVHLPTSSFLPFLRLADSQQRPVGEVLAEWLGDCARLIGEADLFEEAPLAPPLLTNAMVLARHREEQALLAAMRDDSLFADEVPDAYEFYVAAGALGSVNVALAHN